jgi:hypothetical protein
VKNGLEIVFWTQVSLSMFAGGGFGGRVGLVRHGRRWSGDAG